MQPRIESKPAFHVVGMKCRSTMSDNSIPELWGRFNPRSREIANPLNHRQCLGICFMEPGDTEEAGVFSYLCCMETSPGAPIPEGMESMDIPAAEYAVFEHRGPLTALGETYSSIYGEWLPKSGYKQSGTLDFELYDERFKHNEPDSILEIWVPVAKA